VLLLLLYNWALVGSVRVNLYTLLWKYDRLGFGPDVGASGFTPGQALWNMADRFETLHSTLFGWPFYLALAVVVLPFVLWCASRWDLLFAASTLSLMGAYFFFWWPGVTFGVRYWSAAIPWLALLAARGLVTLYDLPRRVFPELRPDRRAAATLPLAFGVVMVLYDLLIYLPAQAPVYRTYQYMSPDPLGVVQRAHLHHALVFVVVRPGRWSYGEVFADNAPSLAGNVVYARDLGSSDRTLMRLYPGRALYRLDNTVLTRLDEQAAARPGGYAPSRPAARRFSSAART
jgi:hypothetical protein